jgi:hypothetical protein
MTQHPPSTSTSVVRHNSALARGKTDGLRLAGRFAYGFLFIFPNQYE